MDFAVSEATATETLTEADERVIEINTYLYIPFVLFIFGAPLVFIAFLCYLQHRSKQLHRREWERLNNRRLST
uniref:G_PROTEIN_RECEP_F1_2 domain-containing protein n=1 Tax=Panagrellus redivivus TaxID=6233 RepID=A0A7E4W7M4_PANRE